MHATHPHALAALQWCVQPYSGPAAPAPPQRMQTRHALTAQGVTQEEAERLAARLAAFPTSASQDAAMLAAKGPAALSPAAARVVRFRMLRKQALAHAIAKIRRRLGSPVGPGHGSSAQQEL